MQAEQVPDGAFTSEDEDLSGLAVVIGKASGEKCERCWNYSEIVGQDDEYPTLCHRCATVLKK